MPKPSYRDTYLRLLDAQDCLCAVCSKSLMETRSYIEAWTRTPGRTSALVCERCHLLSDDERYRPLEYAEAEKSKDKGDR